MDTKDPNIEEILANANNVFPIPATGGRGGGEEYLRKMKTGTTFVVQDQAGHQPKWLLRELMHGGRKGQAVLLIDKANGKADMFWVHPAEWCKSWKLISVIDEP